MSINSASESISASLNLIAQTFSNSNKAAELSFGKMAEMAFMSPS
jgi:hypothetical protein